jgi:hypothetical protein
MKEEVDQECLKNKIYLTFTLQLLFLGGRGVGGGAFNILYALLIMESV